MAYRIYVHIKIAIDFSPYCFIDRKIFKMISIYGRRETGTKNQFLFFILYRQSHHQGRAGMVNCRVLHAGPQHPRLPRKIVLSPACEIRFVKKKQNRAVEFENSLKTSQSHAVMTQKVRICQKNDCRRDQPGHTKYPPFFWLVCHPSSPKDSCSIANLSISSQIAFRSNSFWVKISTRLGCAAFIPLLLGLHRAALLRVKNTCLCPCFYICPETHHHISRNIEPCQQIHHPSDLPLFWSKYEMP